MFESIDVAGELASHESRSTGASRRWDVSLCGARVWLDGRPTTGSDGVSLDDFTTITCTVDELLAGQIRLGLLPKTPPCADPSESPQPHADDPFDGLDNDDLAEATRGLAALEAGVRIQQLRLLASLDEREAWRDDGQICTTNWVCLHLGTTKRTARDLLRVARVISTLPALEAAYANGEISWDQLIPLTQLADPASDADWAADGPQYSAEDLAAMVRNLRITDDQARSARKRRSAIIRPEWGGTGTLFARLANDEMELVRIALERKADELRMPDPETGLYPSRSEQLADALVDIARRELGQHPADDTTKPSTIVVHADLELVTGENPEGHATLADGAPIARATLERLMCDGNIEWSVDGPDGAALGIGRASRAWPPWLARLIRRRDGNRCRWPGCDSAIHEIHHQKEWGDLGRTEDRNGVGFCWPHHHHVHEGGWTVPGDPNGTLTFTSPTGRTLTSEPRYMTPELKRRLNAAAKRLADAAIW